MHLYEKVYEKGLPHLFSFCEKLILNPVPRILKQGKWVRVNRMKFPLV